jgi:hypothetical protein
MPVTHATALSAALVPVVPSASALHPINNLGTRARLLETDMSFAEPITGLGGQQICSHPAPER